MEIILVVVVLAVAIKIAGPIMGYFIVAEQMKKDAQKGSGSL